MLKDICKTIYNCGKNKESLPDSIYNSKHIIGFENYIRIIYHGGELECENIDLLISIVLLINDIETFNYISSIETRFMQILDKCKSQSEFIVFRKAIFELRQDLKYTERDGKQSLSQKVYNTIVEWMIQTMSES